MKNTDFLTAMRLLHKFKSTCDPIQIHDYIREEKANLHGFILSDEEIESCFPGKSSRMVTHVWEIKAGEIWDEGVYCNGNSPWCSVSDKGCYALETELNKKLFADDWEYIFYPTRGEVENHLRYVREVFK